MTGTIDHIETLRAAMAAGPTPGPWKPNHRFMPGLTIDGPDGAPVCEVWLRGKRKTEEATAAFVAAANPAAISALLSAHDEAIKRAEKAEADARRLKTVGAQLANVAFNWAQKPGHALTSDDVSMLDRLRREWDAAMRGE